MDEGEIVEPDEYLIWSEYKGLQGSLCKDDDNKNDTSFKETGFWEPPRLAETGFSPAMPNSPLIIAKSFSDKRENRQCRLPAKLSRVQGKVLANREIKRSANFS